jgi:cytosine/adenosine deaminase-related metal-dependent hydrolase
MGHGPDLPGRMHRDRLAEFGLRAQVLPAAEVLHAATPVSAGLLRRPDPGHPAPGATADLILPEGDLPEGIG